MLKSLQRKTKKEKHQTKKRFFLDFFLLSTLLFLVDIYLKVITFEKNFSIGFLKITSVKNYGVSFSFFQNSKLFTLVIPIMVILFLIYYVVTNYSILKKDLLLTTGLSMIISGALANMYDRILFGFVRDFINMYFFINNPADIFISIGFLLILIGEIKKKLSKV